MIQSTVLDLHICTVLYTGWAGIGEAALSIGADILEIQAPATQLFNGVAFALGAPPASVGGFALTVDPTPGSEKFKVNLLAGQHVEISRTYGNSLAIEVLGHGSTFGDAEGLCGNWMVGGMIGRDGSTPFTPATGNAYGKFVAICPWVVPFGS